jgi:hypothetical protein
MAWASLRISNPQTITNTGLSQYFSMEDGVTGHFETSDATVFANAQGSGISGDPWGIKCLFNGTYLVGENYFVAGGTAGARVVTYHTLTGGDTVSVYQPGRTGALVGDTFDAQWSGIHTSFQELSDAKISNPAPIWINPYAELHSGSSVTATVQTFVQYLGPYAAGNI